jgi:hypothetical protein
MHPDIRSQLAQSHVADLHRQFGRAARKARCRSTRRAGRIGVPLALVLAAASWVTVTEGTAEAATTTSFTVPACTTQNWTVPSGVTAAVFDVYGAAGGTFNWNDGDFDRGGAGGHVHAALTVSPGEVLTISAGGQGGSTGQAPGFAPGGNGGCNGGGAGGAGQTNGWPSYAGAGGGGASDVLSGAGSAILVAAGGGGAGCLDAGGEGGPATGGSGSAGATGATSATGGSQTAGGQPGTEAESGVSATAGATAGTALAGGLGGSAIVRTYFGTGGGAGWYGGGGGAVDSGAGGSNYIAPDAFDGESDGGNNPGQGYVTVTYGTADYPTFTGTPSDGVTGQAYSYQFDSTSWPAPQYFTTDPAALPPGVTLTADGTLSGTPTTPGSYTFDVAAANPGGASSQQFTMTINAPPAVTTQPSAQTVTAGQPVTFTAAAGGYPAPAVQWQSSSNGGSTWTNIPGATTASLTFTATTADNGHSYQAVFTNTAGTATTTAAALTVTSATPTLSDTPAAGPAGTKVTLSGQGFQPSASVSIRLGSATGQLLTTVTAGTGGALTAHLTFPAATLGAHPLVAVVKGAVAAKTTFTVQAHLTVSPAKIAPKASAKAAVTGFKARQAVTLRLGSATGHKLAGLTTSTTGGGTATITIPATTKPGTYKIYAVGSNNKPTVTAT